MLIPAGHILKTAYVLTNEIVFKNDTPMSVADVKNKIDAYLGAGDGQYYPPPLGNWVDGRFHLWDGRHRYIASLMLGRKTMLVGWIAPLA